MEIDPRFHPRRIAEFKCSGLVRVTAQTFYENLKRALTAEGTWREPECSYCHYDECLEFCWYTQHSDDRTLYLNFWDLGYTVDVNYMYLFIPPPEHPNSVLTESEAIDVKGMVAVWKKYDIGEETL